MTGRFRDAARFLGPRVVSILLVSLAVLNTRAAETTNAVVVSTDLINQLVAEARTNNPSLKAADSRVRSATLNAEGVRTWDDPMAMFGGSVYSSQGFNPSEDGNLAYGIEQKLPLWGKPKLNRLVAQAETSTRQAESDLRVQELRRDWIWCVRKALKQRRDHSVAPPRPSLQEH